MEDTGARTTGNPEVVGSSFGLVPTNAPGSRNVIESISWRQSTRAIGRHVGPKPVADLPPNFAHDKGRYHSQLQTDSWQGLEPARSDDFPGRLVAGAEDSVDCPRSPPYRAVGEREIPLFEWQSSVNSRGR